MEPLVSCIMLTANPRAFVPRAIDHFLRQDYPCKELVILDDGGDGVGDLVPDDSRVRYVREARNQPLGAKRNAGVDLARGDLIMHWDDDRIELRNYIWYKVKEVKYRGGNPPGPIGTLSDFVKEITVEWGHMVPNPGGGGFTNGPAIPVSPYGARRPEASELRNGRLSG